MSIYLSLIIPAYNEESRLSKTLAKTIDYFDEQDYECEIIVVDDGSRDRTSETARAFPKVKVITLERNQGKGAAVRTGMTAAKGSYRIFSDADLSTPIYEAKKILQNLTSGYDVCVGSRALDYSTIKKHQPFYREFMGKTFNKIVQFLVMKGIKDTQCGFKGFTAGAAERIFRNAKIDGFGFDVEILYIAHKAGLKIIETSVEWYNDERSTVNPVSDSLKMIAEILKIKKIHG